jgi:hypothetical protein
MARAQKGVLEAYMQALESVEAAPHQSRLVVCTVRTCLV